MYRKLMEHFVIARLKNACCYSSKQPAQRKKNNIEINIAEDSTDKAEDRATVELSFPTL